MCYRDGFGVLGNPLVLRFRTTLATEFAFHLLQLGKAAEERTVRVALPVSMCSP